MVIGLFPGMKSILDFVSFYEKLYNGYINIGYAYESAKKRAVWENIVKEYTL